MKRFTRVATLDGVALYLHWSTIVLALCALLFSPTRLPLTLVALLAYFGLLLIHEWGHVLAARGRRCAVWSIEIYPVFGLTRIQMPHSRLDDAVVAWGGVAAQLVVALPLVVVASRVGFGGPELLNTVVAILGHLSLIIAAFNLVPVAPLDGARAWRVLPVLYRRLGARLSPVDRDDPRRKLRGWRRPTRPIGRS